MELINHGSYAFIDISHEEYRTYRFPNNETITIKNPCHLAISQTGHRILDMEGVSHYIPFGWLQLRWKSEEGKPHFVK